MSHIYFLLYLSQVWHLDMQLILLTLTGIILWMTKPDMHMVKCCDLWICCCWLLLFLPSGQCISGWSRRSRLGKSPESHQLAGSQEPHTTGKLNISAQTLDSDCIQLTDPLFHYIADLQCVYITQESTHSLSSVALLSVLVTVLWNYIAGASHETNFTAYSCH